VSEGHGHPLVTKKKEKTAPNFKPKLVTVENNSHRRADGWISGWMIIFHPYI